MHVKISCEPVFHFLHVLCMCQTCPSKVVQYSGAWTAASFTPSIHEKVCGWPWQGWCFDETCFDIESGQAWKSWFRGRNRVTWQNIHFLFIDKICCAALMYGVLWHGYKLKLSGWDLLPPKFTMTRWKHWWNPWVTSKVFWKILLCALWLATWPHSSWAWLQSTRRWLKPGMESLRGLALGTLHLLNLQPRRSMLRLPPSPHLQSLQSHLLQSLWSHLLWRSLCSRSRLLDLLILLK